jgi:predicted RNA-binding Zn-ribbon protein involved in translation (DUF1610 family)
MIERPDHRRRMVSERVDKCHAGAPMQPQPSRCSNLNHRRPDAPVRFCPSCGSVVNARVGQGHCTAAQHDLSRKNHSAFCVDCGEVLISARR